MLTLIGTDRLGSGRISHRLEFEAAFVNHDTSKRIIRPSQKIAQFGYNFILVVDAS